MVYASIPPAAYNFCLWSIRFYDLEKSRHPSTFAHGKSKRKVPRRSVHFLLRLKKLYTQYLKRDCI